jgi:glycyl-tRNA synthetase beta chain
VGFFAIGELPTGSKDPYALRRAALGVIRLIIENGLRLPLKQVFSRAQSKFIKRKVGGTLNVTFAATGEALFQQLLDFFADRLKVHLREKGVRHDLISAVFELGGEDDLVRLLARVGALQDFIESDDGGNLLIAYRRAANIVRIEEKKDKARYDGPVDQSRFAEDQEHALHESLTASVTMSLDFLKDENFTGAMSALAKLRAPVDTFFDDVTVNVEEKDLRQNRLRLLSEIQTSLNRIADFSQIEG